MSESISSVRKDYNRGELDEATVPQDPNALFSEWLEQAEVQIGADYNTMQIATVDEKGYPQTRIVLLRSFDSDGFVFYTNYQSAKGNQIEQNNKGCLAFFWKELERQVRITGTLQQVPDDVSDAYFESRPRASQIGAWASNQSKSIDNRGHLEDRVREIEKRFEGQAVPRPAHWGGYMLAPISYEFWQGRSSRLHDRILFESVGGAWKRSRLQP